MEERGARAVHLDSSELHEVLSRLLVLDEVCEVEVAGQGVENVWRAHGEVLAVVESEHFLKVLPVNCLVGKRKLGEVRSH